MTSLRNPLVVVALLLLSLLVLADDKPAQNLPKISEPSRMALIRGLNAELVFIRRPFPQGEKGLSIKDGVVSPSQEQLDSLIASYGPSLKTGDRARISNIRFKGDKTIIFEINGGPKKKMKWYEHIQVSGMGGSAQVTDPNADPNANPRGSLVELAFDKYVPELTIDQVKQMLRPVFDFNAISAAQAYMDTLPPKLKEAIKNHQVLVGMNREMVTYALGRPPKKYRDHDGPAEYEEWIYGEPPKEVQFVRFVGDEVMRLEIMKVDGEKIVRTEKEVDMKPVMAQQQEQRQQQQQQQAAEQGQTPAQTQAGAKKPSLRRPGEDAPPTPDTDTRRAPLPGQTDPRQPPPPGSPQPAPPGQSGQIPPN
jgi:hypothetical protein